MKKRKYTALVVFLAAAILTAASGCAESADENTYSDVERDIYAASSDIITDTESDESVTSENDSESDADSDTSDTSSKSTSLNNTSSKNTSSKSASSSSSSKTSAKSSSSSAAASASTSGASASSSGSKSGTGSTESSAASSKSSKADTGSSAQSSANVSSAVSSIASQTEVTVTSALNTDDMFSTRDLTQEADTSDAVKKTVSDNSTVEITEEGVYVISGTAENCTIKVSADKEAKVQLVLDGVNITNDSTPAIYVVTAGKCFVTTSSDSSLTVTGSIAADGTTNLNAVIFSKDDIVFNGTATLNITAPNAKGITAKDDLKITGGSYTINTGKNAVDANDSILICGGTFNITSSNDAFHCENSDDDSLGYIYISGGSFDLNAGDDGFQAVSVFQIDSGVITVSAGEGIEATYVQINNGVIDITASDDGINAAQSSTAYSALVEINGGSLTISMGQGDTDAVDSNGSIIVNGGTIDITAPTSSFDYDGTAAYNGGTIIINGTQVDSIPQSMMGGMGGMANRGGMGGRP